MGHFVRECNQPNSQENRGFRNGIRRNSPGQLSSTALVSQDGFRFDWSNHTEEAQNHALMENTTKVADISEICSITLVFGLFICQRSATNITHKAQSLTSWVTKWHMCVTTNSFADMGTIDETPKANNTPQMVDLDSDIKVGDGDDELDNTKFLPVYRNRYHTSKDKH